MTHRFETLRAEGLRRKDNKRFDKIAGCLIGGAAGDALGYAVEFSSEEAIFARYGRNGITGYTLRNGKALISDDTQMTMFTANALLLPADTYAKRLERIAESYRCWETTQTGKGSSDRTFWLMDVRQLYASRAPGMTCLSAIRAGCTGTIENPVNYSKGCGGVMRVAPIGLAYEPSDTTDLLGAHAAALTHGHEMGYIPAAMLVHLVALLSRTELTPKQALQDAKAAMERLFDGAQQLPEFLELIGRAETLAEADVDDLAAIHELGEGWCGDEALAIALYCALKYHDDLDKALIAAVNHRGDSDSTGAICGNILGAYLGLSKLPAKYQKKLELRDALTVLAEDLYEGVPQEPKTAEEKARLKRYVQGG